MTVVLYISLCLLGFALVSRRLATTPITGPIVFVALGWMASSDGFGIVDAQDEVVVMVVESLFQGTLALLLFVDASALHFTSWRRDSDLPGRLLGISLPLTIALTTALAALFLTDLSFWEAAIVGAITAPTDAALGQAVVSNPRVPERIRQALDAESGLNDGIALPFLLIFISMAEGDAGGADPVLTFAREIGVAVAVGAAIGALAAILIVWASKAGWMGRGWSNIAVVVTALVAFTTTDLLGGSGFIAAFVGGLVYGRMIEDKIESNRILAEELGLALVQLSFLAFGALVLPPVLGDLTWQVIVVAVLALTVARMVPTALALTRTGLKRESVVYLGWFGPRGLATIVFAAEVVGEADVPGVDTIVAVAVVTVGLSVIAHGMTAYPGSQWYADWSERQEDAVASEPLPSPHGTPRLRHALPMDRDSAGSDTDGRADSSN